MKGYEKGIHCITSQEQGVKLAALDLLYLLSLEVFSHLDSTLILIKDLLVQLILILLFAQLEPVVLANSIRISFVIQVQAMLEAT